MNTRPIRESYVCRMEALTPVHVGSGESLKKDFDFFVIKGRVWLVSASLLMAEIEKLGADRIDTFTRAIEDHQAGQWIGQQGIKMDKISRASMNLPGGDKTPREIRAQIRNGFGKPYLPGSSIKGSLRTAIIRKLLPNLTKDIKMQVNDQELCKELLGKDAKMNLMRTLAVGDFSVCGEAGVTLNNALVYRLKSATNMMPKQVGPYKKKTDMKICIEHLQSSSICQGTISLDCFLPEKDNEKKCFDFKARLDLPWLISACRELADHTIATELDFFRDKTGKPVADIRKFYQELQEEQKQLKKNEVIIQMAWGAGWRGMTGQLLEADDLNDNIRKRLNLAKNYLDFPFPKSRRIVTVNGESRPMGWVKISFFSKEELRRKEEKERQEATIKEKQEELERQERSAAYAVQALENFKERVFSCASLPGEIDSFIQQVRQKEILDDRQTMCQALLDKANSLGKKKKFNKALKEGKKWASKLKQLCDENGIQF